MMIQNMFKTSASRILLLTALAFVLIFVLFLNTQSIQNQAKEKDFVRNYLENTSKLKKAFEYNGQGGIKYFQGKLFIRGLNKGKIVAVDTDGNILNHYFEKIPDGIESAIVSWEVDEKGVYMADARRHLITHVGFNNELIYQYKPGIKIGRAGKLRGDHFVINTPDTSDYYKLSIVKVDVKKDSIIQLNYPLANVENNILKYIGFYLRNSSGQTFYVCHKNGQFICANNDGKFKYLAPTIDKSPLPNVVKQGPKLTFDPLSPLVNKSACADNEYLYILTRISASGESLSNSSVIDAYNIEDGQYAWSLKVENFHGEKISMMTVAPDRFYLSQGEFITYLKKPKINYL